jgi:hypothetical protein
MLLPRKTALVIVPVAAVAFAMSGCNRGENQKTPKVEHWPNTKWSARYEPPVPQSPGPNITTQRNLNEIGAHPPQIGPQPPEEKK